MDRKEEFLARLRETFRVEAAEHLQAISAGLIEMEREGAAERASIVERVFREAHSLKGAARSVNLAGVEAICRELEAIFASMKRGEIVASTAMIDAIRPQIGVLADSCASPGATQPPEAIERERRAVAALGRIAAGAMPGAPVAIPRAAAPSSAAEAAPDPTAAASPETVRVPARKLGAILLEAEELVGARIAAVDRAAELVKLASALGDWNRGRGRLAAGRGRGRLRAGDTAAAGILESEILYTRALEASLRRLAGSALDGARSLAAIADRILDDTRGLLLRPCSHLLGAMPMLVRDMSREQGKEADLVIRGEDIEIDRRVLDEIKDPIVHMLRNCVDHGIEKPDERRRLGKPGRGSISITASRVTGNRVEISVADDGSGIETGEVRKAAARMGLVADGEASRLDEAGVAELVFVSGLTTSPIVTDLSGRGLGLAIAREKIEKLGGTIAVASVQGKGTTLRILVPVSLATFRGVLVGVAGRRFMIPTFSVVRATRVRPEGIGSVENRPAMTFDGRVVSLLRLGDALGIPARGVRHGGEARPVVVVRSGEREVALLVDEVLGEQEVMVKELGRRLERVRCVSAASISGSGAVIPVLDAAYLVESASAAQAPGPEEPVQDEAPERRRRLLIAEDSITARTLVKSILEGAGHEVVATVDGMDALTRLKTEQFDLVVSDVDMPRMNGFELTSRIRADGKLAGIPVILVTALGSQKDREYGIEVGANAYIVKSDFDQGNLLEIVRRLL